MKQLHPNNIHNQDYDFDVLLSNNPELSEHVIEQYGKKSIDFSNHESVRVLNKSLLSTYYGIKYWDFSLQNLTPPIPSRVDYIHHLSDLVSKSSAKVLDIGTGASCIYPLLGHSVNEWTFVGTDVDINSIKTAQNIISKNQLEQSISLRHQKDSTQILIGILRDDDSFDVSMCNPPFYKSDKEAQNHNRRKNKNLKTPTKRNFGGMRSELIYEGGEHRFLNTYLYESSFYKDKCSWFTSLVSRKEGVKSLEKSASKLNFNRFKVIPMKHGNKTTRIVCWGG